MKITHLIFTFKIGGAQTMLVDILNEQCKEHKVNLIVINNSFELSLIKEIDSRVKVFLINRKEGSKNPFLLLKLSWLLISLNSDVLHSHDYNIAPFLFLFPKKKKMLTVHDVGISVEYHGHYNKLFSISKIVESDINERSTYNSIVVYNGLRMNAIDAKICIKKTTPFRLVVVSRLLHEKKGQDLVIRALNILKLNYLHKISVDFIGWGRSEDYLKELVAEYHLSNQVNFLGVRNRAYIYSHLKDYNLLIQPSLFEGFGLTVAEGMGAKLPVLVSNIDGPMEIVANGRFGFTFESGNVMDLVEKIRWIIDNYESNEVLEKAQNGYNYVRGSFDIENTAKSYINQYKNSSKCTVFSQK